MNIDPLLGLLLIKSLKLTVFVSFFIKRILEQAQILLIKKPFTNCERLFMVGVRGFEPPISGPPDQRFNRTKPHPEKILVNLRQQKYYNFLFCNKTLGFLNQYFLTDI